MEYIATRNRCAVILNSLNLPISNEETLKILKIKGFEKKEVDLIELARQCIGKSQYRRGVKISEAPAVLDCSSFMKYLYSQRGIWLPRRSIQQRELGEIIKLEEVLFGDLIFISGCIDYYIDNPLDGVGHVGIVADKNTVIHAANRKNGVIESSITDFVGKEKFRGARRYVPNGIEVITLTVPSNRDVEFSDDLRWIVLQSLPRI
ncbi:MAG: NlpC/P60 family protein [Minisyncoccia bacterium]